MFTSLRHTFGNKLKMAKWSYNILIIIYVYCATD